MSVVGVGWSIYCLLHSGLTGGVVVLDCIHCFHSMSLHYTVVPMFHWIFSTIEMVSSITYNE